MVGTPKTTGAKIRHAENGGEIRIDNFSVDGYDENTRTVYEYHSCFWQGHHCQTNYDMEKWHKTVDRENSLRALGYTVVSITSCEWIKTPESKVFYSIRGFCGMSNYRRSYRSPPEVL